MGRNIGQVTPKGIYLHYLEQYFPDQSIQKTINLISKTEALDTRISRIVLSSYNQAIARLHFELPDTEQFTRLAFAVRGIHPRLNRKMCGSDT